MGRGVEIMNRFVIVYMLCFTEKKASGWSHVAGYVASVENFEMLLFFLFKAGYNGFLLLRLYKMWMNKFLRLLLGWSLYLKLVFTFPIFLWDVNELILILHVYHAKQTIFHSNLLVDLVSQSKSNE